MECKLQINYKVCEINNDADCWEKKLEKKVETITNLLLYGVRKVQEYLL